MGISKVLGWGMALILTLIVGMALLSVENTAAIAEAGRRVAETESIVDALNLHVALMADAESRQRAFILTGDEKFLDRFENSTADLRSNMARLRGLLRDHPGQRLRFDSLQSRTEQRTRLARQGIRLREERGIAAATAFVAAGEGQRVGDSIRSLAAEMINAEQQELTELTRSRANFNQRTNAIQLIFAIVSFVSILVTFGFVIHDLRQRRALQVKAETTNAELSKSMRELQAKTAEVLLLNQLAHELQLCMNVEDTYGTIARFAERILPGYGGSLALMNNSRDRLAIVKSWNQPGGVDDFVPEDCCALRSGRTYRVDHGTQGLVCGHMSAALAPSYFCVPMVAQGETLGILTIHEGPLSAGAGLSTDQDMQVLQDAVAGQFAIAVGSLRLRETLRNQTIRDALTGIFNRRYLEISLERELRRAERNGRQVGLMMLDLDHFKRLNDQYGHDAGDEVLRSSATVLKKTMRGEDIVCRYGGEEFSVILPEVSLENLVSRAESICRNIRQLHVTHQGQDLGALSVSIGIAMCPMDATVPVELLKKADERLYEAKRRGRDQVVAGPLLTVDDG